MKLQAPKKFLWKDDEMEEGYYKDQLHKMRYELRRKEDYSEVVKAQKKVVQLEQARDELQDLREAEKEVFEIELMESNKKNEIMNTYMGYAKCLIIVLFITIIRIWLKCA